MRILLAVSILLTSCATKVQNADQAETQNPDTEWAHHAQDPVPNIFGDKTERRPISDGFYEQSGCVASNSTWKAVAHYTYLAYDNVKIGIASYPYSISPSGRLVIIPETYSYGATKHTLKIYDKDRNRFILREVGPMVIRGYKWAKDEHTVRVFFDHSVMFESLSIPKKPNKGAHTNPLSARSRNSNGHSNPQP